MTSTAPGRRKAERRHHPVVRRLVLLVVALGLVGALSVAALLTLSVRVSGTSMEPTLHSGDRLVVQPLGDVDRFALVDATVDGTTVVKRVIGLPGDTVRVEPGDEPRVLVRPGGEVGWYVVDNPTWRGPTQAGCCADDGRAQGEARDAVVPDDAYWLLGDRWDSSTDSRSFGWVPRDDLGARMGLRVLPLSDLGRVTSDVTLVPADR